LAVEMMKEIFGVHGIAQVVHGRPWHVDDAQDRRGAAAGLEVTRSHSPAKVSNDNPSSEAWFKTLKYAPTFPQRFGCLADARGFLGDFVQCYNHDPIPALAFTARPTHHYGLAAAKATDRAATLAIARAKNPQRFTSSTPPKILHLPHSAWINSPPPAEPAA
jgi:putative transposase